MSNDDYSLLEKIVYKEDFERLKGLDNSVTFVSLLESGELGTYLFNNSVEVKALDNGFSLYLDTIRNKFVDSWGLYRYNSAINNICEKYGLEYSFYFTFFGDNCIDVFIDFYTFYVYPLEDNSLKNHLLLKDLLFSRGYKYLYNRPVMLYSENHELKVATPFGKLLFGKNEPVMLAEYEFNHLRILNGIHIIKNMGDDILSRALNPDKNRFMENDDILLYIKNVGYKESVIKTYNDFCRVFYDNYFVKENNKPERKILDKFVSEHGYKYYPHGGGNFLSDNKYGIHRKVRNI